MKIKYNYIHNSQSMNDIYLMLNKLGKELRNGGKIINIFNKNSSLQDILKDKTILDEIEIYYGEYWNEENKCNLIVDYMQDMIIVKYKMEELK